MNDITMYLCGVPSTTRCVSSVPPSRDPRFRPKPQNSPSSIARERREPWAQNLVRHCRFIVSSNVVNSEIVQGLLQRESAEGLPSLALKAAFRVNGQCPCSQTFRTNVHTMCQPNDALTEPRARVVHPERTTPKSETPLPRAQPLRTPLNFNISRISSMGTE